MQQLEINELQDNLNSLVRTVSTLTDSIAEFSSKVNLISQPSSASQLNSSLSLSSEVLNQLKTKEDERFIQKNVTFPVEQNEEKEEGKLSREIKKWVFNLANEVISEGFALFKEDKLSCQQMKVYCS